MSKHSIYDGSGGRGLPGSAGVHLNAIFDFLNFIRSEKGLSQHTVAAYESDLVAFAAFLQGKAWQEVGSVEIVAFLQELQKKKYASSSICRRLVEEGHIFAGISAELGFQIQEHCFDDLDAPLARVCSRETPLPYAKVLEQETLPNKERVLAAIRTVL